MAEETAPAAPAKSGSALKMVLGAVIAILVAGGGIAYVMLKPEPPEVLHPIIWPSAGGGGGHGGKEAKPLELKCTLSDGSYAVVADVRLQTAPVNLEKHGLEVEEELASHKSVILSLMTEVANEMNQGTVNNTSVFRNALKKKVNEELKHTEIESVLVENWLATPID
jgi:flagellar basal body-associated protein FliL